MTTGRFRVVQGPEDTVPHGCALHGGEAVPSEVRAMHLDVRTAQARSILARTSGFIAAAGFTHSLSPARNCTFGCSYCYVPTLRLFAGLHREDWKRWGAFTTMKANAAALLHRALRPTQRIYCSPLVDPYQPAETAALAMPPILDAVARTPPAVFVIQTRGPSSRATWTCSSVWPVGP